MQWESLDTAMHTERMPCEHKGGDWEDGSTSQEMPEIAGKPPQARTES